MGFGGGVGWLSVLVLLLAGSAKADVVLVGRNASVTFEDVEANFAPNVNSSGLCGVLRLSKPLDACKPLSNKVIGSSNSTFVLIIRGGCTFEEKIRNAQAAGFDAAIVYDNEDTGALILMSGSPVGIQIHAVFVSKAAGETLTKYAGLSGIHVWILPSLESSAWSILAIAFISLLAMSAVLVTCFFVRRSRFRREQHGVQNAMEFHGMSSRSVKAMPSLIFTTVQEDNSTSATCAICLEDYNVGDKLRILPCRHKFHAFCVDSWLTSWRTFCPVCKRDARTSADIPPASECTPLLSSIPASASSTSGLSLFHSSVSLSPAIPIVTSPYRSPASSRSHSLSTASRVLNLNPVGSYGNSPAAGMSRNSLDLRNMSSLHSYSSYLLSSHSLGLPLSSSINSRLASPQVNSPGQGSPSYLVGRSSSRRSLLSNSESLTSFSAFSSAESLPENC